MALSLDYVVNGAVGVPVGFGAFARPQHLDVAGDGWHHRTPGVGIGVLHDHTVERATFDFGR